MQSELSSKNKTKKIIYLTLLKVGMCKKKSKKNEANKSRNPASIKDRLKKLKNKKTKKEKILHKERNDP